jgi:hypothetical protein
MEIAGCSSTIDRLLGRVQEAARFSARRLLRRDTGSASFNATMATNGWGRSVRCYSCGGIGLGDIASDGL